MHTLKQYVCLAVLFMAHASKASTVAPNDVPYYQLRQGSTLYLYSDSERPLIDELIPYNEAVRQYFDDSFGWQLDEEVDLLLASPRLQIPNAYATFMPNLKTVWYPGGAAFVQNFAETSWLKVTGAHEVSHLYQLNAKGSVPAKLKKFFGNSTVLFPFFWPVFIHPNMITPTFIIEGNATMNESRLGMGGRLHSGEVRALVLAQIAADDIDPTRLINNDFRFPFGSESYLQGAYFQAHLATKYGVDKTNQFFRAQGDHYLWPFILNKTFRDHFGNSYPQEIREYVRNMELLAKKQRSTPGKSLLEGYFPSPLNHDRKRIFFTISDAKETPQLVIFDKETRQWTAQQMDLESGKVFFEGDRPFVSTSFQRNLFWHEYGMYGEGARSDERYRGQLVTDQRAGKTAAISGPDSWMEPKLLINGEFYDVSHSHAVLDEQGHVYYFRQVGSTRVAYRDREPLAKFEGFYGKPTEVTEDGTLYFIGATETGSSLFRLRGKEFSRVLESDRVENARHIGGDDFLVIEVTNTTRQIKIAHAKAQPQLPTHYVYGFSEQKIKPAKTMSEADVTRAERAYNSITEMRYGFLDVMMGYGSGSGVGGTAYAKFADPLEFNQFALGWSGSQFTDRTAMVEYSFTKYLPDFYARYMYEENKSDILFVGDRWSTEHEVHGGVRLPILRWRRWDAAIDIAGLYNHRNPALNARDSEVWGTATSGSLSYSVDPGLSFQPWREFKLSLANRLESRTNTFTKNHNTSIMNMDYTHGLPGEFFVKIGGAYAWAEGHDIEVGYSMPGNMAKDIRINRLTSHNDDFRAKQVSVARLELSKVFNTPAYSARVPIGINRVAPLLVGQGLFMDDDRYNRYPQNTFEWGYGADVELLLGHIAPVKLRLLNGFDTRNPQKPEMQMHLGYRTTF